MCIPRYYAYKTLLLAIYKKKSRSLAIIDNKL